MVIIEKDGNFTTNLMNERVKKSRFSQSSSKSRSRSPSTDRFGRIKKRNRRKSVSPEKCRNDHRRRRNCTKNVSKSPEVKSRTRSPEIRSRPAYLHTWKREGDAKTEFRHSYDIHKSKEAEYWHWRRNERQKLCNNGMLRIWGRSPDRVEIEKIYTQKNKRSIKNEPSRGGDKSKRREKKRKGEKDKTKKKSKKTKKRGRKSASSSESGSSDGEKWVEVTKETLEKLQSKRVQEEAQIIGPQLPMDIANVGSEQVNPAIYGKDMLKGEAAAMAAYIAQGKRIPRRGEIGLSSEKISEFEDVGYVMSGTRHKAMEATRIRKENQVYSAEEKRMLSGFTQDERKKKESLILSQFRELVTRKMGKD